MRSAGRKYLFQAAALCLALCLAAPAKSFAQCEAPPAAMDAASAIVADINAKAGAVLAFMQGRYTVDFEVVRDQLDLREMREVIFDKLNWFWDRLGDDFDGSAATRDALHYMAKQISAGVIDQQRQLESIEDANNAIIASREMAKKQLEAKLAYQPTAQGCRFDTTAAVLRQGRALKDGLTTGYSLDFNNLGINHKDFAAAGGEAAVHKENFRTYKEKFCDEFADNGKSGCAGNNLPLKNVDVLVGRTIFGKETIDIPGATIAETQQALAQALSHITGYGTPDPIMAGSLSTDIGREQRQANREYIAQMDAVGSMAYSVIADRFISPAYTAGTIERRAVDDIRRMRVDRMGILDASDRPSTREIRESVVEQLWDPNYYRELYDNPETITQKEIYLKAYSLMMLYEMIEKQEKISNAYAIETANIINFFGNFSRGGGAGTVAP